MYILEFKESCVNVWNVKLLLVVSGGLFVLGEVGLLQLSNERKNIIKENNRNAFLISE